MEEFTIRLADVVIGVRCRSEKNRAFFRDYFAQGEPVFTVCPTQDDLDAIRRQFEKERLENGEPLLDYPEAYLENNALHALIAERIAHCGALLMHGSAIVVDGEAYLFTARSGTGKSTHTRLWRERFGDRAYMLNDDKPMLRADGGRVTVYGTPWDGKHHLSRNTSAPLKALVQLERGKENHIEPLSPAQMLPALITAAYRSADRETAECILALESEILQHVSLYRLVCNMDPDAADVAYRGMNEGKE